MTALPLRDFTAAERAKLAAIEAAPAAEESVRERVAELIYDRESFAGDLHWSRTHPSERDRCRRVADDVLAVLSGPSSDAERAVERVLALADDLDDGSDWGSVEHPGYEIRDRIRAAVAGD